MSTWSCEDLDTTTTQDFNISTLTYLNRFAFKVIKVGTLPVNALFTIRILDGTAELLSQSFTGEQINNDFMGNNRGDVNIECTNLLLTPSLDGSMHTYTVEWSATNYTSSTTTRLMLVRRAFDDKALTITNLPTGFSNEELASAYPIFIEFFSFKG